MRVRRPIASPGVLALSLLASASACGDDDGALGMTASDSTAGGGGGSAGTASSAAGSGGSATGTGGAAAGSSGGAAGAGSTAAGSGGSTGDAGGSAGDPGGPVDAGGDAGDGDGGGTDDAGSASAELSVFVTSDTRDTGDLGGLAGADMRCNALAMAVGSTRMFKAYLSAEQNEAGDDAVIDARDRIGSGPWYNAKGVLVAQDLDALHTLDGDPELFLTEHGEKVNGQWEGSPSPNEHDILTGSDAEGRLLAGKTCDSWTSSDGSIAAQVGHSDGLGPGRNGDPPYNSWNSVHESASCADTAPRGGAGKIYCFAAD